MKEKRRYYLVPIALVVGLSTCLTGCLQLTWKQGKGDMAQRAGRQNSEGDSLPGVRLGVGVGGGSVDQADKAKEEEDAATETAPVTTTEGE